MRLSAAASIAIAMNFIILAGGLPGAGEAQAEQLSALPHPKAEVGIASWYGKEYRGRRTASGERFDPRRLTAAHPTLPFGTQVEVRNRETGRRVVVTITDRGPYNGRIIDLSEAAARAIRMSGTAEVEITPVEG